MGDAVISALVNEMVRRLTSAAIEEVGLLRRFKGDILRLKEDFEQIQAVLEDAEEKHIKEKAVELWLQRLRSASFKVENVLDDISTEALLRSLHKEIDIERGIKIGIKYKVNVLEEVLEGLEPNPSLEILKMREYMGKTISPSWMDNLRNLVEIVFWGCKNREHIPPLGRLPSLRVIQLWHMHSLKCFHDDDINMSVDNTDMFICLQRLKIFYCRELISLPDNLPKLEDLELFRCEKLISLPCNLPSIRKMKFEDCDGLLSLPDEIQT